MKTINYKLFRDEARCTGRDALSKTVCLDRNECLRFNTYIKELQEETGAGTISIAGIVEDEPCPNKLPLGRVIP